jgi:hypothetical protein
MPRRKKDPTRPAPSLEELIERILSCPDDRYKVAASRWWAEQEKAAGKDAEASHAKT